MFRKHISIILCLFTFACTQNSYEVEVAEWDPELYLKFDGKSELEQYFDLLNAKNIEVNSKSDEDYEGFLSINIEESDFIDEHLQKGQSVSNIMERLAFLLASRVEYLQSYKGVEVIHKSRGSSQAFTQFYALEDLGFSLIEEPEVYYEEEDTN
ncbi:MAG: hypothetical protein AAF696_12295 [Bacteroidota bacterium]